MAARTRPPIPNGLAARASQSQTCRHRERAADRPGRRPICIDRYGRLVMQLAVEILMWQGCPRQMIDHAGAQTRSEVGLFARRPDLSINLSLLERDGFRISCRAADVPA